MRRQRGDSGTGRARRRLAEAAAAYDAEQQGDMTHEALHSVGEPDPAADTFVDGRSALAGSVPGVEDWPRPVPLSSLPEAMPFPLDALPDGIAQYAGELAWATNTPVDFVVLPLLAIASASVGNARQLAITRTHRQPLCLWCAVVGRPGSGKSAPLEIAQRPLREAERRYRQQWQRDKDQWSQGDPERRGPAPKRQRCLLNDATGEAVVKALGDNPRGLLLARDELAAMVTGMDQYKEGGKGNERQMYLSIWGGASITLDRIRLGDESLYVRYPFLSIAGTIQPGVVEIINGQGRDQPAIGEQWREVSEEASSCWDMTITRLLSLDMGRSEDGDLYPLGVRLSYSGRAAWEALTQSHADEVNDAAFPDHLRGPWAKLVPGYAGRLALLLSLLADGPGEVEAESVERAASLVAYFKSHAKRVRVAMDMDQGIADARRVLAWIDRDESIVSFTRRDAHKDLHRSFARPDLLDAPLHRLVDHGYILPVVEGKDAPRGPGRKASQRYLVSPFLRRRVIDEIDTNA